MSVLSFLLTAIIVLIIAAVAEKLSPFSMPGSWAGLIIAGFIGEWIGTVIFGPWGPTVFGISLIPVLVGSFIVIFIVGLIADLFK
ncbi:Transglycosylase associated protein [Schinkia azotoformans MEV2011]|uniref:Transglycosylase n=2 Tax=Schinkia azotoformans TaxID=1454 RepID=K6E3X4_SCHAZ|nr:GlsB/YeaQ/YmgE family stress response membrane protein [Schinkia azotoformans]EKN67936.1 transglycosylase [Schinkia azotoformans LMG 9581]KEF37842.1 Transglycosylase associated protein [Schinkia azotoformans MEV2011]MEC1637044.1 GlsB/YeaQ/YmgE family stress response membrane protein [Schinkia azotoformans]MEC1696524.1 GlsB/YeaQ/YmgE family stress response membrane protein [Schinkia azotoformans]MEC1716097.1 GlsB/YeaQ/YmgE family stress response membrane protein [Schinkia azotoformans]